MLSWENLNIRWFLGMVDCLHYYRCRFCLTLRFLFNDPPPPPFTPNIFHLSPPLNNTRIDSKWISCESGTRAAI